MTIFCIILLVLSIAALTAEIIMRSVLKIENFGLNKRWLDYHGKTIPSEDFLPHDVFEILIFAFSFSVLGLILTAITMPAVLTVFCGIIFGCLILFAKKHLFERLAAVIKRENLPKNRPNKDDKAVCTERITKDGYGRIEFEYKGKKYTLNAVSVNETDIEQGEKVTVVHKEDGACWVEKETEEFFEE